MRRGNHDAAGAAALTQAVAECRRGRNGAGQKHRDAGCGHDLGAGACKGLGAETGVIADAQTLRGVFVGGAFARVHVGGNGLGRDANVGEGEIVGDNRSPAVGAELDLL